MAFCCCFNIYIYIYMGGREKELMRQLEKPKGPKNKG